MMRATLHQSSGCKTIMTHKNIMADSLSSQHCTEPNTTKTIAHTPCTQRESKEYPPSSSHDDHRTVCPSYARSITGHIVPNGNATTIQIVFTIHNNKHSHGDSDTSHHSLYAGSIRCIRGDQLEYIVNGFNFDNNKLHALQHLNRYVMPITEFDHIYNMVKNVQFDEDKIKMVRILLSKSSFPSLRSDHMDKLLRLFDQENTKSLLWQHLHHQQHSGDDASSLLSVAQSQHPIPIVHALCAPVSSTHNHRNSANHDSHNKDISAHHVVDPCMDMSNTSRSSTLPMPFVVPAHQNDRPVPNDQTHHHGHNPALVGNRDMDSTKTIRTHHIPINDSTHRQPRASLIGRIIAWGCRFVPCCCHP